MVPDIDSNAFVNKITYDKKENMLLKKYIHCAKRKCSKINKERSKAVKKFEDLIEKNCTNKDNTWYECVKKLDKKYGPKNRSLHRKYTKCGKQKCSKENKTLKKYQKNMKINDN